MHITEDKDVAVLLIEKGADPRIEDNDGDKPADYAEVRGRNDIACILRAKEQELDLRDRQGIMNANPRRGHEASL